MEVSTGMYPSCRALNVWLPGVRPVSMSGDLPRADPSTWSSAPGGSVVNITSAMVKAPFVHMSLSTTARAGLTAFCKAVSRDVAVDNVTINNLLPERIDTGRQQFMIERRAKLDGVALEDARQTISDTIAAKRFGTPEEFGSICAYLCSDLAGFISGQNVQVDGGTYPGLM